MVHSVTKIISVFHFQCCGNIDHLIFTANRTDKRSCSSCCLQQLVLCDPQAGAPWVLLWAVLVIAWQLFGSLRAHRCRSSDGDSHRQWHQRAVLCRSYKIQKSWPFCLSPPLFPFCKVRDHRPSSAISFSCTPKPWQSRRGVFTMGAQQPRLGPGLCFSDLRHCCNINTTTRLGVPTGKQL